jgi:hypothetical protein
VPEESGQELRFGFVRGTDLLVAEFQLRNLRVTADGTRLEREVPGEPAHVIVWLPAQHVLERALPMGDELFLTRVALRVTAKPPSAPSFSEGSDLDRPGRPPSSSCTAVGASSASSRGSTAAAAPFATRTATRPPRRDGPVGHGHRHGPPPCHLKPLSARL